MATRWLFGDQLGPHFVDDHRGPLLMVESTGVFRRRRFHRAKAHLVLSAMRHRAAELGDRLTYVQAETYAEAVREHAGDGDVEVVHPTSYAALGLVERLGCTVLPPRGFATAREDFERWAEGRRGKRLLMEDFYRRARQAHGVLLDGGEPAGGQWNFDHDNREPPPKGADDARGHGAVVADRGRHRRAGARGPRPLGARRRGVVHRPRRPADLPRDATPGAGRARALRRAPAAGLRGARGRDPRGRPVDGAQPDQRADEPRPARPARGRGAGGGGLPQRCGADRERRGLRPAGDRLARLRVARLLAHGRGLPARERAPRDGSGSRSGSPSSTARRPTPAASRTPSTRSPSTAGCTTSRG